jgi:hypothetical protein
MPRSKKKPAKKKAMPAGAARYRALHDRIEDEIANQPAPFDTADSMRDRLFALVMQRIDVMQAARDDYLKAIDDLMDRPSDVSTIARPAYTAMRAMLQKAGAPTHPGAVAALSIATMAVVAAWRNDTTADLDKTMKACDRSLRVLETLAQMVYGGGTSR